MKKYVDLHTHSTASDGTFSPRELVRHAKKSGLRGFALTDHDTISGITEALEEAGTVGIEFIPGVEISVQFSSEMHILGYFNEGSVHNVENLLEKLVYCRNERNPQMLQKLNSIGVQLSWEEILEESCGGLVARLHFAKALVRKGHVATTREAFERYLSPGKPAYVAKDKLSPEEGIGAIIKAGGVPVLAHPILLRIKMESVERLICERLKTAGLMGIEAVYVENTQEETESLKDIAKKHGLLITGGSDFHGDNKEWTKIGIGRGNLKVDYRLFEELQKKINEPA